MNNLLTHGFINTPGIGLHTPNQPSHDPFNKPDIKEAINKRFMRAKKMIKMPPIKR